MFPKLTLAVWAQFTPIPFFDGHFQRWLADWRPATFRAAFSRRCLASQWVLTSEVYEWFDSLSQPDFVCDRIVTRWLVR